PYQYWDAAPAVADAPGSTSLAASCPECGVGFAEETSTPLPAGACVSHEAATAQVCLFSATLALDICAPDRTARTSETLLYASGASPQRREDIGVNEDEPRRDEQGERHHLFVVASSWSLSSSTTANRRSTEERRHCDATEEAETAGSPRRTTSGGCN